MQHAPVRALEWAASTMTEDEWLDSLLPLEPDDALDTADAEPEDDEAAL